MTDPYSLISAINIYNRIDHLEYVFQTSPEEYGGCSKSFQTFLYRHLKLVSLSGQQKFSML